MPFTLAHPAVVLPLKRLSPKYVSMTGLVIGSMLPDFEYFIRMNLSSLHSHTPGGVLYFDLPLGIVLAFIFHSVVRNVVIDHLPNFLQTRFAGYKAFSWSRHFRKHPFIITGSLLTGIFTHIFWDAFTHETGFFVENIAVLSSNLSILNFQVPVFKILQHGSTLLGSLFILCFIFRLPKNKEIKTKIDFRYWSVVAIFFMIIVAIRLGYNYTPQIGNMVVISISAGLLSLIISSLIWKYKKNRY